MRRKYESRLIDDVWGRANWAGDNLKGKRNILNQDEEVKAIE